SFSVSLPLFLLLTLGNQHIGVWGKSIVQWQGDFDHIYSGNVNNALQNIYAFNHTVSRNKTEGVRVYVNVLSEQAKTPVLFVVRQQQAVLSFQVPLILRGLYQRKYTYQEVSRTLCQPEVKSESQTQFFYVDVSTLSGTNTSFQLFVKRVVHFVLRTGEPFRFNATPSQPQYVIYKFPEGLDSVIVKVTSDLAFPCSVVSIQDILVSAKHYINVIFLLLFTNGCPVSWQKKDFPSSSFYVVVVVKTEDEACGGSLPYYPLKQGEPVDQGNRSKTLNVVVVPAVKSEAYVKGMLFGLGVFLAFYLLTLLIACWENSRSSLKTSLFDPDYSPTPPNSKSCSAAVKPSGTLLCVRGRCVQVVVAVDQEFQFPFIPAENGSILGSEAITDSMTSDSTYGYMGKTVPRPRIDSLSSIEEDEYDTLADIDSDKNVIRTKKYLYVSDLARKDKRVLSKKYKIYFWNIATIAVFYALPVIQLVITYQTVVNITGNQDICYYNFLCAHPLGVLSAFNNILSNLGYIMLGLLFLLIVLQREILHKRALLRNDICALECGIPKHFGLFYAMGTALMMEGLLSACYHVCPNYTNFQFDTSFMYMIAGLCMLKLYQKRHPDINASAYSAYACLALVIFFSVLGVVFGKDYIVFWAVFSFIHILATLLLSIQLYYMGRWKLGNYPVFMIALLCSLAAYGLILRPKDFASYLLAIGICNLLLYFAFYIIMKLRSGEKIKLIPLICILFTAVVWGFALFFFFQGLSTWEKTPAESREHNRDCILLDFFDDHDIWHFLSSIALFGSFLVLLTLDDDLDRVQRDKIYVF
uniref:SID1 transmembrane family member 2 n=1 Tax=Callorhinchus milii TaxID=7868 RepID=A0A4W3HPJ8_CALMI